MGKCGVGRCKKWGDSPQKCIIPEKLGTTGIFYAYCISSEGVDNLGMQHHLIMSEENARKLFGFVRILTRSTDSSTKHTYCETK